MREKASNVLHMISVNKKTLLLGCFVFVLLALTPFSVADAQWYNPKSWGDAVVDGIASIIVTVLTFIPAMVFFMVAGAMNWMIGIVTNIGIIPGAEGTPQFVEKGWEFTRDLANALFILILVFIGLATILRLQNYQLQKTLPALLIVALLVNFSGVFVGFIVDMGNLVSVFFLNQVGAFGSGNFANIFATGRDLDLNFGQSITYGFVMMIFYLLASLIFFVVFLLFLVRTIILWTLTILAPLAFASYILPVTRGMLWNQWLKQLILWSIIGIPIGFFLYLSNLVLQEPSILGSGPSLAGSANFLEKLLSSIMSPLVGLVLLGIGVMLSLQFAPAGANSIVSLGQKWGRGVGKLGATAAWRKMGKPIQKFGANIRKRAQGNWNVDKDTLTGGEKALALFGKIPGTTLLGRGLGKLPGTSGVARFGKRGIGYLGGAIEQGAAKTTRALHDTDESEVGKARSAGKDKSAFDNATQMVAAAGRQDWNSYLGWLLASIDNGDSDDIRDELNSGRLNWKHVDKALEHAEENGNPGYFRPIIKAYLDKVQDGTLTPRDYNYNAIWNKFKGGDIKNKLVDLENMTPEAREGVMDDIFLKADTNMTTEALTHPNRAIREWVARYAESKGAEWFVDNGRQDTLQAVISSGGRTLGLPIFGGLNNKDIQEMTAARTQRMSDAQLEQKVTRLKEQIGALDDEEREGKKSGDVPGGLVTKRRSLRKELKLAEDDQRLRKLEPEQLENERASFQSELVTVEEARRTNAINDAEYYLEKAQPQRKLERAQRETQRRDDAGPVTASATDLQGQRNNLATRVEQLRNQQKAFEIDQRSLDPQAQTLLDNLQSQIDRTQQELQTTEAALEGAILQESSEPIGRAYQQWAKQEQRASELQASLQQLESRIVGLRNERDREQVQSSFNKLQAVAQAEKEIAQKRASEVAEVARETQGLLSRKKQREKVMPLQINATRSSILNETRKNLTQLRKDLREAEATQQETQRPSPPQEPS